MNRLPIHSLLLPVALMLLQSCQTLKFYGQAAAGQFEILSKSRPSGQVLDDPATPPDLRRKLLLVGPIRQFASDHLSLPGHGSYGKYADLGRDHVVWVIYAAPEFSLDPKTWNYPVIGPMDYRGYFDEKDARAHAALLHRDGYDVVVAGVDAYSTLGWFHDPVLNTFVDYPDIDLAELIFHELAHRKLFRRGDTVFSESLANVVAEEGVKRWLKHEGRHEELRCYQQRLVRRREFHHEIERCQRELEALYASGRDPVSKRREKARILERLQNQFRQLRRNWGGVGLESWLKEDINNAHIVSLNIYAEMMPTFKKLLDDCKGDFELFFKRARHLPGTGEYAEQTADNA